LQGAGNALLTASSTLQLDANGASSAMVFKTVGTERMRIDSSGNVGIGADSPADKLEVTRVSGSNSTGGLSLTNSDASGYGSAVSWRLKLDGTNISTVGRNYVESQGTTASFMAFQTVVGSTLAERMRIDSSGNLLVGRTSTGGTAALSVERPANTATYIYQMKNGQVECTWGFKASTDSNMYIGSGSTAVGTYGVYLTNTGNSWNAVSDERMKTIVEPIENAAEKVSSLRAVIGYYNNDESQTRRPFLIAQDVQEVLPEAVNIQDVETGTLGMSYTDTIPLLVAAIKEQQTLITQLQADVAALKA